MNNQFDEDSQNEENKDIDQGSNALNQDCDQNVLEDESFNLQNEDFEFKMQ